MAVLCKKELSVQKDAIIKKNGEKFKGNLYFEILQYEKKWNGVKNALKMPRYFQNVPKLDEKNVINQNVFCFNCLKAEYIQLALKKALSRGELFRYSLHIQGVSKNEILKTTFCLFRRPVDIFIFPALFPKKNYCWIKILMGKIVRIFCNHWHIFVYYKKY